MAVPRPWIKCLHGVTPLHLSISICFLIFVYRTYAANILYPRMKTYAIFQEYVWLVNTIHQAGRISLEEINRRWIATEMSGGVEMSRSTFNRHRNDIGDVFGLTIECDKKDGFRYYIENEEVLEEDSIQNWMLSTIAVNNMLVDSKCVHDRIVLETIPSHGEFLYRFIDAMKRSVRIKVSYRKYGTGSATLATVEPYFVRLVKKRWYGIVKFPGEDGYFFVLAFDRIVELTLSSEKFTYRKDFDPQGFFRDNYGIVSSRDIPVQRVVLRAYGQQMHYYRDLPLHHSQKELQSTDEYTDFEVTLRPTEDFYSPLLSRGPYVKVMEPKWLADEIKKLLTSAAKLYEE